MSKNKKIIIVAVVAVVLVAIGISAFFIVKNNTFSYNENNALSYARKIKNNLKSPDSLKFHDDILYIAAKIDDEIHIYFYFDYTAKNSFGTDVRSQFVFIDGEQRDLNEASPNLHKAQDYEKKPNEWEKARQENLVMLKEHQKVLDARTVLNSYKLAGSNGTNIVECEVISSKKIARKL